MAFELADIVKEAARILLAEPGKGTKIEFIFQMQAQFAANLGRLKATVTRLGANVEQLTTNMLRSASTVDNQGHTDPLRLAGDSH